ncbi:restriction endonuclease subunit S [Escherichia coli]|nr:restriction endonuclease subunit S [Escherichia coli]EIB8314429.1 restriction endonuclease subunit S [Escherichia coli]ELW1471496.1 restriction endonuclease subunit S [Escherichia coli]ELY7480072.1 restriction endonuclease subunit S [Escherichia coli]
MGSKWIEVSLDEISEKIGDGIHGTPTYNNSGNYYFINGSNLIDNSIKITETTKCVDHDEYLKHRKKLSNNTVLVSINGTIGNTALYNNENIILGKSACYINLKDNISKHFILYVLSGYLFQEYIQRCSTGSTIKNVSLKMMRDFRFLMPESKEEQEKVVRIIQKIDELKRLNNAQNQTLEQMSQTLFKSWFVDFDPVIDNALDAGNPIPEALQSRAELRQKIRNSTDFKPLPAEICSLFPSEFEETELGWVPEGWETNRLENILELAYGKALKKTERIEGDYPVYGSGGVDGSHNEFLVKGPGIIVGRKGTVGSLYWEDKDFYAIDTVFYVKPKKYFSLVYCYQLLKTLGLENMNTDAAVPGLNRNNAYRLDVIIPTQTIIAQYTNIVQTFRYKMDSNHNEINNLTNLRNTLLPKLISGELSLEDLPDLTTGTEAA